MSRDAAFLDILLRDRDRYIYRVLPLKYLYDLFDSQTNFLPAPQSWEDPFEDLLGRSGSGPALYAQCWSLHYVSDAMWRIYSPDGSSVRIRSTVRTLLGSLAPQHPGRSFIGKVRYLRERKLEEFARKNASAVHRAEPRGLAKTLLVKRSAFKHEREIRLILAPEATQRRGRNGYRYSLDPHSLVDQIMLDPRLPPSEANQSKMSLRKRIEFQGKILRSLLYAPPKELIAALQQAARPSARRPTRRCS